MTSQVWVAEDRATKRIMAMWPLNIHDSKRKSGDIAAYIAKGWSVHLADQKKAAARMATDIINRRKNQPEQPPEMEQEELF